MPANKAIFQDSIKQGHNAAWDGNWTKAVAEYRRAVVEFPADVSAHLSLAHALEQAGQLEDALHECRIASKLTPHDAQPLVRIAALQEKLGLLGEAAGTYLAIAEILVAQKAVGKAVEAWQKAAALEPGRTDVHLRLADIYEKGAHRSLAAKELVALSQIYNKRGDKSKAQNAATRALKLDPHNQTAAALCNDLERLEVAAPEAKPSPVDKAQQEALSRLAETLLEEHNGTGRPEGAVEQRGGVRPKMTQPEIDALIARAVDAQTHHRVGDAVESYRKLLAAGVERTEVKFNLGLLYLETMRYPDAVLLLEETVADPNYTLASHFALGQCHRAQGQVDEAVEHFLEVTKIVDLGSVRREQADELISVYEGLAESYVAKGDREQAESFSRALEEFLTSKGWEDKVREVRHHLEMIREEDSQVSLAQVIEMTGSAQALEALALSQEFMRRGRLYAATEECFRAIELAPNYIPAHLRLGEIMTKGGRIEEAREKFQTLAGIAAVRGETAQAERFYRHVLKLAPDDAANRSRLIDLLLQQGRGEDALDEYLALGDEYIRVGQYDQAAEKFAEGVRLATREHNTSSTAISLRHRLGDARLRQADFVGALVAYQELRELSPEDERAHVYVVDLELRLGQLANALRDLEELLVRYRSRNELGKAIAVLEGWVQSYPNETSLRARLAQGYMLAGEKEKAIAALDALGELQLSLGQKQAAAATVRQIVAMDPPRIDEYRQLLQQIGE